MQRESELQNHASQSDQKSEIVAIRTSIRPGTGPRTPEGKKRSKRNATKHGIFSSVVVLRGEDRTQYESLLNSLWVALRPEGGLEELLAEKLASISWRHRRLLVAESAEIQTGTEFLEWDRENQEKEEAKKIGKRALLDDNFGLMRHIQNSDVLERCLELLNELRQGIETSFNQGRDISILEKIYGERDKSDLRETLYDVYSMWFDTTDVSDEERQREGYATPEECKQNVLHEIDAEIRRLKLYKKTSAGVESHRTKLEIRRRNVPDSSGLDRLLRYEASLERSFDRTLSQLERLQRMRLGQPVTPRIDVSLSS